LTSVTIPGNVRLVSGRDGSFPDNFNEYYDRNGKKAGVYSWNGRAWSYAAR
jgi:hypothetical protein